MEIIPPHPRFKICWRTHKIVIHTAVKMGDHVLDSYSVFSSENSKHMPTFDFTCVCILLSGNQELWSLPFLGRKWGPEGKHSPKGRKSWDQPQGPNPIRFSPIIFVISIPWEIVANSHPFWGVARLWQWGKLASGFYNVSILVCASPGLPLFCGLSGERGRKGTGQLYQACFTHSPTEILRLQVDRVEPVDASGEVHIVSAVCVGNTST